MTTIRILRNEKCIGKLTFAWEERDALLAALRGEEKGEKSAE
jgi:hypothetical protein